MRDYEILRKALMDAWRGQYCSDCELNILCQDDDSNCWFKQAADAIEELLAFAKFVAREAIDTGDNDGVSAEILCRKLNKLGLIETDGEFWMLPAPPKENTHD